jgi:formate dehydrogenase beta subunit
MARRAILYDATKCIACRACQVACKQQNELQAEGTRCWATYENPPYLSAKTWLRIKFQEVGDHEKLRWLFLRESCMHCEDASCVNVCPEGALYHHQLGFVALNREKCTGCETCVRACPFGIPRMERESWDGRFAMKATKCTFCQECIEKGTSPACVEACPTGALKYDDRDDLVAEGRRRVDNLKMEYPNACLYGEKECGGLHVVYILQDSPEVYGLPTEPKVVHAPLGLPVKPMMWSTAAFLAILTGLGWIISRRKERMKR